MELTNEFTVAVPIATAWGLLTDVERIAPCMPGAQLQEVEGDEYRGIVKVKVGPITAQYKGAATFVEQDVAAHRAVLRAEGRETRGQGNASALITANLAEEGDRTKVTVITDLTVTGKVAQFGRGVMADVSAKLLGQFVECLESTVLAGDGAADATDAEPADASPASEPAAADTGPAAAPVTTPAPEPAAAEASVAAESSGVRRIDHPDAAPVDLLDTAGAPIAKRVGPIVALVALGWLIRILVKRRRRA